MKNTSRSLSDCPGRFVLPRSSTYNISRGVATVGGGKRSVRKRYGHGVLAKNYMSGYTLYALEKVLVMTTYYLVHC